MKKPLVLFALSLLAASAIADMPADIAFPPPRKEGGKPLLQALAERRTAREFDSRKLETRLLGDLLWAANGINREDGRRTAPTARNWQEIDLYVVLEEGAFRYDPKGHRLTAVVGGDLRKLTGMQPFVATAPVNLVFVADTTRMAGANPEDRERYAACDTGFVSQNVYLFCASEGLATVVRGLVDRPPLAAALKLPDTHRIILAQTVGYPRP